MPTMRSGCIAFFAMSAIGSAEVFVAMTASVADDVLELLDHVALHRDVLEDRLDDEIRAPEAGVVGRSGDARDHARALAALDDALARRVGRELAHRVEPAGDRGGVDVAHAHGRAADRGGLRDARAHEARADDRDVVRHLAARQTLERGFPLREPQKEQRDEIARHRAGRELAEETRLGLEARVHSLLETDLDRLERLQRRGVVALRLGERVRERACRNASARSGASHVAARSNSDGAALHLAFRAAPRAIDRGALERGGMHDLVDQTGAQRAARVAAARRSGSDRARAAGR